MKTFPVLNSGGETIPWEAVEPHRRQAAQNHGGQSLERLAERGGLSWGELYYTLTDSPVIRAKHEQVDYRRLVLEIVEGAS